MTVRTWGLQVLAGVVLGGMVTARTGAAPVAGKGAQMWALRRQAAWRKRRLVFNNDGDDHLLRGAVSVEAFLAKRSTPLIGSQVDTVVYCTSRPFGMFTHNTLCFGAATSPTLGEALWRHVRLRAGRPGCRVYDVVLSTRPADANPRR